MKCEQGDIAKILMSLRPSNIGKTVLVENYIGHFEEGEEFDFRGIVCKALISDHYWWVSTQHGLINMIGDTPKAYIPDSWLEPLRPTKTTAEATESIDLFA